MIGGSSLAQAFDRTHSPLFDLSAKAPSSKALVQYRREPIKFATEILRIPEYRLRWSLNPGYANHVWDGTPDPIATMLEALADEQDVCVEAATGTQKSYTAAIAVLWFSGCWEGSLTKTWAPSEEQLRAFMWKEIGQLWPSFQVHFPSARLLDLEIRMRGGNDNSWGAKGVSVRRRKGEESSVGAQGAHAPHMLHLMEEMPGIDQSIVTAVENTCTAPHNLRCGLGNPDHQLDTLHTFGYDQSNKPRPNMRCIRISAHDHPNIVSKNAEIVPGAVAQKSVDSRRIKYVTTGIVDGKTVTVEGRLYKTRVRGLSPAEAAESLIKLEWIRRAQERWRNAQDRAILELMGKGKRSLGVDASNSKEGDHAAISRWIGAVCQEVLSFPCPNSNNLGFKVHLEMDEKHIDPEHVGVDPVGVGAGTYNELLRFDKVCVSISGGDPGSTTEEQCLTYRSRVYWTLREDLRQDLIALPPDDELERELITPTWKTVNSIIRVEPKEDIQGRTENGRSPNKADAVAYGNYVRPRDPAATTRPKTGQTREQRVWQEVHELEDNKPKKFFGTMRQ